MKSKSRFNPFLSGRLWLLIITLLLGACSAPPLFQQEIALTESTSPSDYQADLFTDLSDTVVDSQVLEEFKAILEDSMAATLSPTELETYTWVVFGEEEGSISTNLAQGVSPQTNDQALWIPNPETNTLLVDATIYGRTPLLILDRGGQRAVVFDPEKLEAAFGDLLNLDAYRVTASVIRACGEIVCPRCGCVDPMNTPPSGTPIPTPKPWPHVISVNPSETP